MNKPGISAQLIVYGGRQNEDLAGVIGELAAIGYDAAEIGSNFVDADLAQVSKVFADNKMVISGIHSGFANIADAEWGPKAVEACKTLGVKYILCSGVAPGQGIEPYLNCAAPFNTFGKLCCDNGITFCYHNHGWEFESFDGVKGIHKLCEVTDPELVKLNVDVYWVTVGGENPAEFIDRYGDRVGYYHFKDGPYTPTGSVAPKPYVFTELGRGTVDLKGALAAAMRHDPVWITYEQDRSELEAKEACRISFECLKSLGL
jgi:sugar phosphate isomerase/epimerase